MDGCNTAGFGLPAVVFSKFGTDHQNPYLTEPVTRMNPPNRFAPPVYGFLLAGQPVLDESAQFVQPYFWRKCCFRFTLIIAPATKRYCTYQSQFFVRTFSKSAIKWALLNVKIGVVALKTIFLSPSFIHFS